MSVHFATDGITLHLGDCLDVLPTLPDASIDAVLCDPPYALAELATATVLQAIAAWMAGDRTHVPDGRGFMGADWDGFVPPPGVWGQCMRVLKPGGHLLAFAGSRTVDLMGLSIRIAGFEIRDGINWIYGSGFAAKGIDVSKAIDKAAGAQRAVIGQRDRYRDGRQRQNLGDHNEVYGDGLTANGVADVTAPATEDAARWQGWHTTLKPAHEPIIMARKPFPGTVAGNVLEHGTGGINIDGCRTAASGPEVNARRNKGGSLGYHGGTPQSEGWEGTQGRWPTNVILSHPPILDEHGQPVGDACADGCVDGCPVAEMDRQSGNRPTHTGGRSSAKAERDTMAGPLGVAERGGYDEAGGASRFFPVFRYQVKAPAHERPRLPDGTAWPTVKPLDLMRWLVRLVTPPGGVILDPFAGTGTTLEAAALEEFPAIGVERDPVAAELSRIRLSKPMAVALFGDTA